MITTTTIIIILVMLLPTPRASEVDLESFEKFCRTVWRGIVITVKLVALTIALVVACYAFGGDKVFLAFGYAVVGIAAIRIFLMMTEFVIPDRLYRFLSEMSDPEYLLKRVF